jgi:hypothetical protein
VTYGGPLGELEVHGVDPFENLLGVVHTDAALLGQRSQAVPLVTDLLAPEAKVSARKFMKSVASFVEHFTFLKWSSLVIGHRSSGT